MERCLSLTLVCILSITSGALAQSVPEQWRSVPLQRQVDGVAPWTGIVLWNDNEKVQTDAIQLEYSYVKYNDVVSDEGSYDWSRIDALLDEVADRKHQAVLRFYFVYPGRETTVPAFITRLPDYNQISGKSEGKTTGFVDWSHPAIERFTLDFYSAFAQRYDDDPRLAYLQTGFGLWAEYHIYSGPRKIGQTFPSKSFQAKFLNHMAQTFKKTPWMISVDAADTDYSPFEERPGLLQLRFGVFDDSFLCKPHAKENALNWRFLGRDRWLRSPGGGEFSYYNRRDQKLALSPAGPNGRSFEDMAGEFHVSFMIGSDQPRYQSMQRIKEAGMAIGYRMTITECETDGSDWRIAVTNTGIAPMYHDAHLAVAGKRSSQTLKGLLPGKKCVCEILAAGDRSEISIESDRLVPGQTIPWEADIR